MKTCFIKVSLFAVLASVALSAGAKPAQVQQWESAVLARGQNANLTVAARRGFAGTSLGPKVDTPISCATPTQGT